MIGYNNDKLEVDAIKVGDKIATSIARGMIDVIPFVYDATEAASNPVVVAKEYTGTYEVGYQLSLCVQTEDWVNIEWLMLTDDSSRQILLLQGANKKNGTYIIQLLNSCTKLILKIRVIKGHEVAVKAIICTGDWLENDIKIQDMISSRIGSASEVDVTAITIAGSGDDAYTIVGADQAGAARGCCVALGYSNLTNNMQNKIIAIGNQNLRNNTGSDALAIGYHALFRNTSGRGNLCVGNESGDDNLTGSRNTSIGVYALQRNNIGSDNTALGWYALSSNIVDTDGPGSAYISGGGTRDISYNTAIGSKALYNAKSGCSYNIAIGYAASEYVETYTNTIVIGNSINPTASNQIHIGDNTHTDVYIAGKRISFNQDGSVTWSNI